MTEPIKGPKHPVLRRVVTVLGGLLVFCALTAPREIDQVTPAAFLRIPIEGLVVVALLLVLPARPRRVVAAIGGALLGLLTIIKIIDMGFLATVARPFDPVLDWTLVGDAYNFVHESFGAAAAVGASVLAAVLVVAVMALMTLAALRLTGLLAGRRRPATRSWRRFPRSGWARRRSARSSWTRRRSPRGAWPRSPTRTPPRSRSAWPTAPSSRRRQPSTRSAAPRTTNCSRGSGARTWCSRSSRATAARRWRTRATPRWWTLRWTRARSS